MSWSLVGIVLGAALLHAAWNALIKSGGDKAADTALVLFLAAVLALPASLWAGLPPAAAWPYLAVSVCIHAAYHVALVGAYRHGELGLTYPIMRGFAPLLVALASGFLVAEAPSALAWLGIVGITAGVALVGLGHPGVTLHRGKALAYAFTNAGVIACYTLVDGLGARAAGAALQYVLVLSVLNGLGYPLLVWVRRDTVARRELLAHARTRWPLALLGAAASIGAYGIALWAMTRAPVASVAALRETSVLFAALLGTLVLKERFGLQRAAGTMVLVGGVVALRFG